MRWILISMFALVGCGGSYEYTPTGGTPSTVAGGEPAAKYQLPRRGLEKGDLRVASYGVSEIETGQGDVDALHVRVAITNDNSVPWTFDARRQRVTLATGDTLTPAFTQSDKGGMPRVTIPPGARRTVDMYFPLPDKVDKESEIPQFDVHWVVNIGPRAVAGTTPFERLQTAPTYAAEGWGYPYYGPYTWYDPWWGPGWIGRPYWW